MITEANQNKLFFLIGFVILALSLFSKPIIASGGIRGVVVDSASHEKLIGANIVILGTSMGAATNLKGEYSVSDIPAGHYTVKCSYVGYKSKEAVVVITNNKTVDLNFSLVLSILRSKEVVVTAQALGQAAAINQQINSNNIVNVVSEQKIQELPDANAAAALGRLPGISVIRSGGEATQIVLEGLNPKYTTVTEDGIKLAPSDANDRGTDLSTISQGSLAGIKVYKTVTSAMDADAIAGSVDFITKQAPDKMMLRLDSYGIYNGLDRTLNKQFAFDFRYGERFFNKLLGVQLFGNASSRDRSSESTSISWSYLNSNTDYQISDFNVQYVPEIRRRYGGQVILDYNTPDNGVIKFNIQLNRQTRLYSTISRDYPLKTGSVQYNINGIDNTTNIFNTFLKGNNHLLGMGVDWSASFVQSSSNTPYGNYMSFEEPSNIDYNTNTVISGMRGVPQQYWKGPPQAIIPYAVNNFSAAFLTDEQFITSYNIDKSQVVALNLEKHFNIGGLSDILKAGGKNSYVYHGFNNSETNAPYGEGSDYTTLIKLPNGTVESKNFAKYGFENLAVTGSRLYLLTNFLSHSPTSRNIEGKYPLNPLIDPNRIRAWYEMTQYGYLPNAGTHVEHQHWKGLDGNDYNASENIAAAYLMNTLNIGHDATLILGVRLESESDNYAGYYTKADNGPQYASFTLVTAKHNESHLFPNAQLILRPLSFANLRFAAYEGVARPDFNLRIPKFNAHTPLSGTDNNFRLVVGNPNLKDNLAWNYDASAQFFNNTIGLFTISGFYKIISDQTEYVTDLKVTGFQIVNDLGIPINPDNNLPPYYLLSYPFNSDKPTKVWGFEIEHQANFRWLPGFLQNIILDYNLSVIHTETYSPSIINKVDTVYIGGFGIPKSTQVPIVSKTPILNSPRLYGNLIVGYDIGGFSARISYFYQANFYNSISLNNENNVVRLSYNNLDLSIKQEITNNISVGVNITNLTNTVEGTNLYNDVLGWKLPLTTERYGTTGELWLRLRLL